MEGYTYNNKLVQNASMWDILLFGPDEIQYDVLGVDKTNFKKVLLYIAKREGNPDRFAYWLGYFVNDTIRVYTPNK